MTEAIDSTLSYGESRNAWIVEACQMRLETGRRWTSSADPEAEEVSPHERPRPAPPSRTLEHGGQPVKPGYDGPPRTNSGFGSFDPDEVTDA